MQPANTLTPRSIVEEKFLFGAYLNMARNNLRMVFKHVQEKVLSSEADVGDDAMKEWVRLRMKTTGRPDEQKRLLDLLKSHLPFLPWLVRSPSQASPTDYADALLYFIEALDNLRNFHAHFLHEPYTPDCSFIESLRYLFDVSRRKVKVRFSLTEEEGEHLVRKVVVKENGQRKTIEKTNYPLAFAKADSSLSEKGLAFFICLLLERKYATLFLKQLRGFKDGRTKKHRATLEAYSILGIRIPRPRLQSDNTREGLLLEIIEELKRCPADLFGLLSPADQQRFRTVVTEEGDEVEVLLKRYGDRFPHLALRYLELTGALPGMQFHIDLGKFNFEGYEKEVDGELRLRQLQRRLKGFGHLKDFAEEKMPSQWRALVKSSHELEKGFTEPHIVHAYPHYHFVNNAIGISFSDGPSHPPLTKQQQKQADAWLSLYELPAMMLLHLLTRKDSGESQAQWTLKRHVVNIKKFFIDVQTGGVKPGITEEELKNHLKSKGLQTSHVPDVLIRYLLGRTNASVQLKTERKLCTYIDQTKDLLARLQRDLERAEEKPGSRQHKLVQTFKLADFLARDFLLLQPPVDGMKGKATSPLFQVLQARLAFYGRDKNLLSALYRESNLIDSINPHPFLYQLSLTNGLVDYYHNYLLLREKYLGSLLEKCMRGRINSPAFHFLHLGERERKDHPDYHTNLAGKFMDMPLNLPRGLFMEALKEHFSQKGSDAMKAMLADLERVNTVYLLQHHLNEFGDRPQAFYDWPRHYAVFDRVLNEKQTQASKVRSYYANDERVAKTNSIKTALRRLALKSEEERVHKQHVETGYRFFDSNEKWLRHVKACDITLFFLLRDLAMSLDNKVLKKEEFQNLKLEEFVPDNEIGVLSKRISLEFLVDGKTIWDDDVKIKSYGNYRRFLKDNRVRSLLSFYSADRLSKKQIEEELTAYDKARIEIQRAVLDFEEKCVITYSITIPTGAHYVPHREGILEVWDFHHPNIVAKEKINNIRGSFMHNHYPDHNLFSGEIDTTKPIAGQFVEIFKTLTDVR